MIKEKFEKREVFCMFRRVDTELGYIQCTIKAKFKADFIKLGFVDNVDKLGRTKESNPSDNSGLASAMAGPFKKLRGNNKDKPTEQTIG